jgi:adenylosuccinate lyase
LKSLTRGQRISAASLRQFIGGLAIPDDAKAELLKLSPATYIGLAEKLAKGV